MIPEYNKIDFEKDDLLVIDAKKKILENAVEGGLITQEEFDAEKTRVLSAYDSYCKAKLKLGYAFTW